MVIITYPTMIENEASLINQMFDKGLPLLHVRKPKMNTEHLITWINKIDTNYHSQIVIHINNIVINNNLRDYKELLTVINNFNNQFIHLSTDNYLYLLQYNSKLPKLSTSVHCITELNNLSTNYNRVFISPIFPSISKKGYSSNKNWKEEMTLRTNHTITTVALGGITPERIPTIKQMGFDDYALLGAIWEATSPLKTFELCQHFDQL
ncbi:MAG: thiamine phosphate synthase [Flavobacteriaceae bacterium]|jgi:thiamine-phosphate pyrophosphorylase|nr:thiamine phosphate synthase [Flavobacteriaceae bacterium]